MLQIVLVLSLLLQGSNPAGDSLSLELRKTQDPEIKASIYYNLAKMYYGSDQDLAIAYADSSIAFGEQANAPKMKANAINVKAVCYLIKSDFETSMKYNLEALKIRETIQDTVGLIDSYINLGNVLYRSGNSEDAVERYKIALKYAKIANNQRGLSLLYNNIGNFFRDKWTSTGVSTDLDSAKFYLNQSLEIKTSLNDSRAMINTLNQLAKLAQAEKNFILAESFLNRGLEVSKGVEDKELRINMLTQLTEFNLAVGDKAQALTYAQKAFEIAEEMESNYMISNVAGFVSMAYEALGNYKEALKFNKKKLDAEQLLTSETNRKIREDLLIQYESEKKELENQRLLEKQRFLDLGIRRKNELLIGAGFILFGLIGIGFYQRKKNLDLANTQQELKTALSQLTEKSEEIKQQAMMLMESNKALKGSNAVRERLLSVVSHDLKTPLNSLKLMLDFWGQKVFTQEEMEAIISKISEQIHTVEGLLENLLHWAQTQMEYNKLQFTIVNLRGLIQESITLVKPELEGKKLTIFNEIPEDVIVYSDRDRLDFIIRNLISNALKFTPSDGQIKISYVPTGKGIIQISDTGVGISKSRMESIFSQGMGSSLGTEGEKGSGVGLLLCKEFAESLSAKLEVMSEEEKGSTFMVNLG